MFLKFNLLLMKKSSGKGRANIIETMNNVFRDDSIFKNEKPPKAHDIDDRNSLFIA